MLFWYIFAFIENPKDLFTYTKNKSFLFTMQDIYPEDSLRVTDLAEVDLSGFQILVSQDYFRHHFEGDTVPAGIGG